MRLRGLNRFGIASAFAAGMTAAAYPSALHGAEPDWFRVNGVRPVSVLWVRAGPAVTFKRIGFLRHDARHIQNLGCEELAGGTWCRVRYRRTEGWVSRKYLARDTRFKA